MQRPIFVATIGYIIGIGMGLYFKSVAPFYMLIFASYFIFKKFKLNKEKKKSKVKLISFKRYLRYLKIVITKQVLILIFVSSLISYAIVYLQNNNYAKIYKLLDNEKNLKVYGIVVSDKKESSYYDNYVMKTAYNGKNIKLYLKIKKSEKINLSYGDRISLSGTYEKPEVQRNYKGFSYLEYLKQLKIYGTVKSQDLKIINRRKNNSIFQINNNISVNIKEKINKVLPDEEAGIFRGVVLGDTSNIEEDIQSDFRNAGIAHILAVSGMHIAYVILGINLIFSKILGKRKTYILSIIFLLIYMFITNFSPSVTRAGIMSVLFLFSKIIHRKNDAITSISISLLIILIYNPFLIKNLGVLLSFGGVLGIVFFNNTILNSLKKITVKNPRIKYKITAKMHELADKVREVISISLSVQIFIIPIILYNINTLNPYFLISNLLLSFLIGPILIACLVFSIIVLVNEHIAMKFSKIISFLIRTLINISKIGELPFSRVYIPTPSILQIAIYYIAIFIIRSLFILYFKNNLNKTQKRFRNLIALIKFRIRQSNKKAYKNIIIMVLLVSLIIPNLIISKDLKIYFIDVGQGDSTLIVTPKNQTILIDGGGSEHSSYDVGKNTLLPYILDRGFRKIDFIMLSHFDTDHSLGCTKILENLTVSTLVCSEQLDPPEPFAPIMELAKEKNVKLLCVKAGDKLKIDGITISILHPTKNLITENSANNNSIVCKLEYNSFSMLFTGDIEEIAEKEILNNYKNDLSVLKATVLKVGHHGSKTSSTEEFIKAVSPKVALIGVGKNNNFGHPNENVIQRIEQLGTKVYRTDINGEISITVNHKGKIKNIENHIQDIVTIHG